MHRFAAVLLLACATGHASTLFGSDAVLEATLSGPLSSVIADTEDRREREFILTVADRDIKVAVRMRGKSRTEFCNFPPLRLNFARDDVSGSVFDGEDKLKLVTHCKASESYEKNVVEEYAAYRIMNVLSDLSMRARLLRLRYVDTERSAVNAELRYALLLESDASLAARLGATVVEVPHVVEGMFDPQHSSLVYVFQYLIGNTDWSLVRAEMDDACCHNGRLIKVGAQHYYLPYDFDMSGLVNARYARPNPRLKLSNVRLRRYRGYCLDEAALRNALQSVIAKREAILNVIAELPLLSERDIEYDSRYLRKFFQLADREDKLLYEFKRRCLD